MRKHYMIHYMIMTKRGSWFWDRILNEIDQLIVDEDTPLTDIYAVLQEIRNHTDVLLKVLESKLNEEDKETE